MAKEMFGSTPMLEGLQTAGSRMADEIRASPYFGQPVLFLLSDGEPSDAAAGEIVRAAEGIKDSGVLLVSCYVTDDDIAEPRRLYGTAPASWPDGAKLMLECASPVPPESAFSAYLREYNWNVDRAGRLFTQINQSEVLSEFMNLVLSPLQQSREAPTVLEPVRVFVSYSHRDAEYVSAHGLLGYLAGLKNEGVEFWLDDQLVGGDQWDASIRREIEKCDISLVLVSQAFLNSPYCQDVEIEAFLRRRAQAGLVVFPVIISPCDWKSHEWLRATQFEPRDAKTVETDFKDRGSRDGLYLRILTQLREVANRVRAQRRARA